MNIDTSVNAKAIETYNNAEEQYVVLQSTEKVYQEEVGGTKYTGEYYLNIAVPANGPYIKEDETWSTLGAYDLFTQTMSMGPKISEDFYHPKLYEAEESEKPVEPTVPEEEKTKEPDSIGITISDPEKKVKVPPLEPVEQATKQEGMPTGVGTTSVLGTVLASIGGIYLVKRGKREE